MDVTFSASLQQLACVLFEHGPILLHEIFNRCSEIFVHIGIERQHAVGVVSSRGDGQKAADAEAEMRHKFGEPQPGEWEFRQFLVVHPIGDADPKITADLRARAAAAFPQRKKSWLSRLFGR